MRIFPRVLIVALMLFGMYVLIEHLRELQHVRELQPTEDVDNAKMDAELVTHYIGILGLAVVTAIVFCVSLLPLLGELVGNIMFTPNQQIERSPHGDALAKLAAGDFEGAIEEYKSVFDDDPLDTHAASEVVRLYCEKLHDPEPAMSFLVEALSIPDRTPEDIAFLSQRMVDVCWNHKHDGIHARAILIKIAEDMPETREAANAVHRLQEIERIMNSEYSEPDFSTPSEPAEMTSAEEEPAVAQVEGETEPRQ